MPTTFPKNLNLCFTKIKFPLTSQSSSSPDTPDGRSRALSSTAAAAAAATPSLLFKNYNSLYDNTIEFDYATSKSLTISTDSKPEYDSEPDFATVFASKRFFFTSPGSSNSIVESTPSSIATTPGSSGNLALACSPTSSSTVDNANRSSNNGDCDQPLRERNSPTYTAVKDGVAVSTFSPNPYMDFRRSMQEMVEARDLIDVKANWDFLHELLLCYLALNPKSTHKFIIGAFADLLVTLMEAKQSRHDEDGITGVRTS